MEPNIQTTILRNLINDEDYTRSVIPFLKKEYFENNHRVVFDSVVEFVDKYNKLPTQEALSIELTSANIKDGPGVSEILGQVFTPKDVNKEWLLDETEKWCQDRSIYLAIMESINIIDGKHNTLKKDALPQLLSDALGVCFDTNVGHDYIDNSDDRFEFYHKIEDRIPFDLEYFNKITKDGLPNKTLNIALAGTGVGKSLFMCHVASSYLLQGLNVLYITLEMAEERIAERIDANLLDVTMEDLHDMPQQLYEGKITKLREKTQGQLVIKEYPTASAHSGHFKSLINELALKKSFRCYYGRFTRNASTII